MNDLEVWKVLLLVVLIPFVMALDGVLLTISFMAAGVEKLIRKFRG